MARIWIQKNPKPDDNGSADAEEQKLDSGSHLKQDIEDKERRSKHYRQEKIRSVVLYCILGTIVAGFVAILAAGGALVWHMIAPEEFRWLSNSQYTTLKSSLFSGAVISAGVGYVNKYLKENRF